MSDRHEEKALRQTEREAQKPAVPNAAGRGKRLQLALGALLVGAVVGGSTYALTSSGGGQEGGGDGQAIEARVPIPPVQVMDLSAALAAAQCVQVDPPNEGSTHVAAGKVTYRANPPTSGDHRPPPAPEDGNFPVGDEPEPENWVHSLEHGRVLIQYAPGTPRATRDQLETLGSEKLDGAAANHVQVMQNNTNMPYAVAAVAWDHLVGCKTMNPQVFDAFRAFRAKYTDKAPELVP